MNFNHRFETAAAVITRRRGDTGRTDGRRRNQIWRYAHIFFSAIYIAAAIAFYL
jgi:hypothetical protein